tara:strand:- start:22101 stop:22832 length:732 start_codon:yes stop_codon:yes gene_type:complete
MTINEVYKLVQIFANKEQRGFVTPADFNLLAKQAEIELYNKRLSIIKEKTPTRRSQGVYKESLTAEMAKQDISGFLLKTDGSLLEGEIKIPSDYIEAIYSSPNNLSFELESNVPVEIVEEKDISNILRSSLAKPSTMNPVALISMQDDESVGTFGINEKNILIFPDSIPGVRIYHYYYQNTPKWNYITIAGKPVYSAGGSRNFVIASRVHGELVIKILEYLGVNIREPELVQYAQANELKADS